jgi:hypothetical protein
MKAEQGSIHIGPIDTDRTVPNMQTEQIPPDTGMHLRDLLADQDFIRREKNNRDPNRESVALRRLSRLFADKPESVLQELVDTAVKLCGADSSGISLEEPENGTFRWIVVAGSFAPYLNGRTSRTYSPCGTCLDLGRPQLYSVTQPFYDHLGVTAEPILDGMLIPWSNEFMRGTLWAVSHNSNECFTSTDYELLNSLADFASIILRHQRQQEILRENERTRAAAEMANKLAHRINNPLQSLTNTLYLAQRGTGDIAPHLAQAAADLQILSRQVATLLDVSSGFNRPADRPNKLFDAAPDAAPTLQ